MSTEPRPRPPARDCDHRVTVIAALLLAACAAALAYVLLGGHHGPVECESDAGAPSRAVPA
ncbi:hypothetical protein DY245_23575 [Streptomyces inhibens]|uniref:Uncharacterized protein n=1 Tax=Streptomyces inhibens TaxID=2293571 RepID=A0A371Q102_STRIH|nr:hypothetical protein [Streptomyces inhibens]REK88023.1 hypothetical protein DY245_23575 [Streptomyces inhibens]